MLRPELLATTHEQLVEAVLKTMFEAAVSRYLGEARDIRFTNQDEFLAANVQLARDTFGRLANSLSEGHPFKAEMLRIGDEFAEKAKSMVPPK